MTSAGAPVDAVEAARRYGRLKVILKRKLVAAQAVVADSRAAHDHVKEAKEELKYVLSDMETCFVMAADDACTDLEGFLDQSESVLGDLCKKLAGLKVEQDKGKVKLSELKTPKFSGEVSDYLSFKSDFYDLIVERTTDKIALIKLREEALVKGSPEHLLVVGSRTVSEAMKVLDEQYSDSETQKNALLVKLRQVPPIAKSENAGALRQLVATLKSTMSKLELIEQGETLDSASFSLIMTKLPHRIRMDIDSEIFDKKYRTTEKKFKVLLEKCQRQCQLTETHNYRSKAYASTDLTRHPLPPAVNSLSQDNSQARSCIFHPQGSKHRTPFCHKLNKLSAVEILSKLKENGHCLRCLCNHTESTECEGKCPESGCTSPYTHSKALHAAFQSGLMSTMSTTVKPVETSTGVEVTPGTGNSEESSEYESDASSMATTVVASYGASVSSDLEHSGQTTLRPAHVGYIRSGKGKLITVNMFYDLGSDLSQVTYECIGKIELSPVGHLKCLELLVAGSKTPVPFGRSDLFILPLFDSNGQFMYNLKCAAVPYIGRLRKVSIDEVKCYLASKGHETGEILEPPEGSIDISVGCNMPQIHPLPVETVNSMVIAKCPFGRVFYGSHPSFQASEFSRAYIVSCSQQSVYFAAELVDNQVLSAASTSAAAEKEWDLYDRLASIENGPCSVCDYHSFQGKDEPRRRAIYEECLEFLPEEQRVVARLPWAVDLTMIPDNKHSAMKRLEGITKSLQKDPALKEAYKAEFQKMISKGILVEVSPEDQKAWKEKKGPVWYTAHFPVLNDHSSSTPVRVVFDASVPYKGFHLAKLWESPPNLIPDIKKMFLGFRERPIAFCMDFSKAYWTVFLRETESHMQRILWNDLSCTGPVSIFRMTRNSFGMVPSGAICSLAMCLVAEHYKNEYPKVHEFISSRVYVDDGVSSCETVTEAIQFATDIRSVMSRGSFDLKHFVIGCAAADTQGEMPDFITFSDEKVRILGTSWDTRNDVLLLTCSVNFSKKKRGQRQGPDLAEDEYDSKFPPNISLRIYLSVISSLFDPLGLSSPVSILLKHELGRLFELKLGWDDWVPHGNLTDDQPTFEKCKALIKLLYGISSIPFTRCLRPKEISDSVCPTLVGFCDSSQTAYAACLYLNWPGPVENERKSFLMEAKAKPFPKRGTLLTIPRGELMSCLLLARLVSQVQQNLSYSFDRTILLSDATIALHQIKSSPIRLKIWPAVRVEEIQNLTGNAEWFHISSCNNIADCATRGLNPGDIGLNSPWQVGQVFMTREIKSWPIRKVQSTSEGESKGLDALMEIRPYPSMKLTPVVGTGSDPENPASVLSLGYGAGGKPSGLLEKLSHVIVKHVLGLDLSAIERISDWHRLRRTVARIIRFLTNLPEMIQNKRAPPKDFSNMSRNEQRDWIFLNDIFVPSISEMNLAVIILVKKAQENLSGKLLASMKRLKPDTDTFGLWRALGRVHGLESAPYIIPSESPLARTLLVWFHRRSHSGADATLALAREWFWIVRGQVLANRVVSNCAICRRRLKKTVVVEMAPLEVFRKERAPVFSTIFIDLCGPYTCKADRRTTRASPALSGKVWILVVVCSVTHALHLEVVEGYDTQSLICALDNFISFRSRPKRIIADRGSQITAAAGVLKPLWSTVNVVELQNHLCDSTEWIFAPPGAHAFIGMAERMVKIVKDSIQVMTCAKKPVLEKLHFSRLLNSIANLVNDRPLTVGRNRVSKLDDVRIIRPNDLLLGRSSVSDKISWNDVDVDDLQAKRTHFLDLLDQKRAFLNKFWLKFQTVVFHTLLPASKWLNSGRPIRPRDIVLIRDTNPVRGIWTVGQVEQIFRSKKDNKIRKALVRYKEALGKEPKDKRLVSKSKTVIKCVRDLVIIVEHDAQIDG